MQLRHGTATQQSEIKTVFNVIKDSAHGLDTLISNHVLKDPVSQTLRRSMTPYNHYGGYVSKVAANP
mgnify:FL=1